jgi:hypothetical protein
MQAQFRKWEKWRDAHRSLFDLERLMFQIRKADRNPATRLSPAQAGKLLALLKSWQSKPVMTEAEASRIIKRIKSELKAAQRKALAERRPGFGPGGPPPGGPGFGGPPPGERPDPPPGGMRDRMAERGGTGGRTAERRGPMGGSPPRGGPGFSPNGPGFRMPDPPKTDFNPLNPKTLPMAPMRARAQRDQAAFVKSLQARAKGA